MAGELVGTVVRLAGESVEIRVGDLLVRARCLGHLVQGDAVHAARAHSRGSALEVVLDAEHCVAFADGGSPRYTDDLTAVTIPVPRDRVAPELARRLR